MRWNVDFSVRNSLFSCSGFKKKSKKNKTLHARIERNVKQLRKSNNNFIRYITGIRGTSWGLWYHTHIINVNKRRWNVQWVVHPCISIHRHLTLFIFLVMEKIYPPYPVIHKVHVLRHNLRPYVRLKLNRKTYFFILSVMRSILQLLVQLNQRIAFAINK